MTLSRIKPGGFSLAITCFFLLYSEITCACMERSEPSPGKVIRSGTQCFAEQDCWPWQITSLAYDKHLLDITLPGERTFTHAFNPLDMRFCDVHQELNAEEDNCTMTGVFFYEVGQTRLLVISGHFGAHSQALHVFDPLRDADALLSVKGSYFVAHTKTGQSLEITHDSCTSQPCTQHRWVYMAE